jgi:hypothetical protein
LKPIAKLLCRPGRSSEHVAEDRLGERVEAGENLATFGAKGVGVVEDRGDAALLGEGR